ncbi:TPA: hypothetical protein ACH3X1_007887 [Trebouxia sp. C0004]
MPALNEQAYELAKPECQVQRTDQVFLIRFTGEVFPEYELYLGKLNFYRQRQWSCQVTGKHGLTYEEAATSEQKSRASGGQFPAIYEEPVMRHIHHSTHKLDDLAGRIAAHFRDSFVCGEEVLGSKDSTPTPCRVVAVHEAPPVEGVEGSVFDTQYDVQWVAAGQLSGEPIRMPRTDLFRKKPVVTKPMLKTWIAEVALCEMIQGVKGVACIWRAIEEFVDKYNLALELPTDLSQKLKKAEQRKAQQANKASNKAALAKAADQQAIKDEAAAIVAAAFAQGAEAEDAHPKPDPKPPLSIKEQAAAVAAAAFAQAPPDAQQAHQQDNMLDDDDDEDDGPEEEEEASEPEMRVAKRKRVPVPRPSVGTPVTPESLEEVEQRLQPGSVKHAIFQVLKNYGHKGQSVGKIVEEMSKRGLRDFSSARNAKSSVASTCAHDTAFARVAPGTFALRAVPGVVEVPPSTPGTKSVPATHGEEAEPEEAVIKPAPRFAKFDRNNFKCSRCLKMHHPEGSPLALCDTCPRSFHLLCMGLEWEELSEGDWSCPRCAERKGLPTKRLTVDQVKNRQSTGGGRMSKAEQEKTDKMLIKSLEREERERKRAEERAEKEAQRQMEKDARNREREEAKKMARYPIEDADVAEEEMAALLEAEHDVRHAMQSVQSSRRLDEQQQEQQEHHLAEAEARLKKLQLLVQGPSVPQALFSDAAATASYVDALAVVEFVSTFGRLWEAPPISLPELQQAVENPVDHSALSQLYNTLLSCVLLDQVSEEGSGKSRARRWARVVHKNSFTWPEILRRYLLATRAKTGIPQAQLMQADTALSLLPDNVAAVKGALELANKPWYRLSGPMHLRLLTALCNDTLEGANMRAELAGRVDQISALQSERHQMQLEERRQEKAAERERKQEERQKRLQQLEQQLQGLEQETAAATAAAAGAQAEDQLGDGQKPDPDLAETPGDQSAAEDDDDDDEEEDNADQNDSDKNDDNKSDEDNDEEAKDGSHGPEGSTPEPEGADARAHIDKRQEEEQQHKLKQKTRQDRDAEFEARIAELTLRTEPVGLDRHHCKFWVLTGDQSAVHVQSADGFAMSAIDSPEALDAALAGCNRKGNRERALQNALKRDQSKLRGWLQAGLTRGVTGQSQVPPSVGGEVNSADRQTIEHAMEQLKELLGESSPFQGRLPNSISFKDLQQKLGEVQTVTQLCEEVLGIEGAVSLLGSGPRGTDSIAKATTQPSLPASDVLPQPSPSPSPDPTAAVKPNIDADTEDRLASHASAGPSHPVSQPPAAMQWVETDDLGDSKRQVPAIPRPSMPNGALNQLQSGLQHPQGSLQQLPGGLQQPQDSLQPLPGSLQQPQGSLHYPPGNLQQPQRSDLVAQAALQQPQGRCGMIQGFSEQPRADAEPAGDFMQQSGANVKQEIVNNAESGDMQRRAASLPSDPGDQDTASLQQLVPQADLVFAQPLEELDPSDTEQEKASRPKLALWRSARERGIWMRDMMAAQVSNSAAEVAYLAAVLSDKAQPMLQRLSASAAAAAARPPKAPKSAKRERETPAPDQGAQETKKLKVKLAGGSASGQGSNRGKGPQRGGGHDRWMAECADCGEEGDLLCCEAKDCPVAMHMECAGLDKVPRGKWYCPEHAASLGKSSKAKPSSAKSSGNLDSTALAPSNSGKTDAAGASAPSKAGSNIKAAAGGKAGRAHSEDDSADGQAPKKGGKAGKGKVPGEDAAAEGSVPKKGGGKAGKDRTAAEQTDPLPKAPSKTTIKLKTGGSSKAGKAHPDAALAAAAGASAGKPPEEDVPALADRPANGNGAKAKGNKGKEPTRKRSAEDKTVQKGAGDAAAQANKKAPEGKFEASDVSEKGSVKVKFKRLKKHQE